MVLILAYSCTSFQMSEKPLEGLHIVVDAGNGAGGFFAVSFSCYAASHMPFVHFSLHDFQAKQ